MRKKTVGMALCGILCGLSVVIIALSGVFPSLSYAIPMIAGALLVVPSIEFGTGTALTAYAAVSILSVMLLVEKQAPLMYIFIFGIYPIIKKFFERIPRRWLEYAAKFAYFNAAAAAAVAVVSWLMPGDALDDGSLGKWTIPVLLILGNVAFLVYDHTLTLFVTMYVRRFQAMLHKALHIK